VRNIILKEYEQTQIWDLNSDDILEVEKINNLFWINIFDIKAKNVVKAKQFVGVVQINDKNITILPKIFWEEKEEIVKNLLYMLAYTKKLNIRDLENIENLCKVDDLFEVFIFIFARELFKLLKKNFKKWYNKVEENSNFLKGKFLISKHLKFNLFNKTKFFVEYEKMDENILLNIFLKAVVKKLLKFTRSRQNFSLLKKCEFILQDVDDFVFKNAKSLEKIKFTRNNKEYKNIFFLAKTLYFGNSPNFLWKTEKNFFILFDMNLLFEEFIWEFLRKNKKYFGIENIVLQSTKKYVFKDKKFLLKPDIIAEFQDKKIIIDTKYKKLSKEEQNNWVSSSDIYQMFMYWMRYFNDNEEKNIILLYPEFEQNFSYFFESEENIKIHIKTVNLNIKLYKKSWLERLKQELRDFVEEL